MDGTVAAYESDRGSDASVPLYAAEVFRILTVLFVVLPIIEIWVLIRVAAVVGGLEAVSLVILVSVVGAWLVRREGMGVLRKVEQRLAAGELPSRELVDGVLIAVGGALMLTPGFVTDAVSLLLLFPPTRIVARTWLMTRYRGRIHTAPFGGPGAFGGFGPAFRPGDGFGGGDVVDVGEATYEPPGRDEPGEITPGR